MKIKACFIFHLFTLSQKKCLLSAIYVSIALIQLESVFHIFQAISMTFFGLFSWFSSNNFLHLHIKTYRIFKASSHNMASFCSILLVSSAKTILILLSYDFCVYFKLFDWTRSCNLRSSDIFASCSTLLVSNQEYLT